MVLDSGTVAADMGEEQAGIFVNKENLFNPVQQGVQEDDFCEGLARPIGLQPPSQAFEREAMLDGLRKE